MQSDTCEHLHALCAGMVIQEVDTAGDEGICGTGGLRGRLCGVLSTQRRGGMRKSLTYGSVRGCLPRLAAQVGKKIIAPLQYKSMMHALFFEEWFEKHLISKLTQRAVIVMDNASFHRKSILMKSHNSTR